MVKKLSWLFMTVMAVGVAGYAGAALLSSSLRTGFVQDLFTNLPVATSAHLAGGMIAILLGALQVSATLRKNYLNLHRWLGRIYVVAVITGGIGGFVMALDSTGGLVTHFGFGLMAVCWVGCTVNAYRYIRAGNIAQHRAWMLRSYALTLAAVTLRIYLPLSQVAGYEFVEAYRAISWMCWVPNLLVVEWFMLSHQTTRR